MVGSTVKDAIQHAKCGSGVAIGLSLDEFLRVKGAAAGAGDDLQMAFERSGGVEGDRTLDLRIANAALSQLSYHPS